MSSTKATSQEQPGIVAGLSVFVGCAVISCIAWYPLGGPVYAIALAFRGFGCANVAPGSLQMFFCSAGVALLQLLPAAIALVLVFVFRKPLMRWVQQGITTKLSPGMQFLVAPAVATCLFVIVWAGVHYTLPIQTGLLPQIIFPAVIGLFTFIIVRYGDGLRRALDPFFESRDRFPRWLRFVAVLAVPLLISVLITQPWREDSGRRAAVGAFHCAGCIGSGLPLAGASWRRTGAGCGSQWRSGRCPGEGAKRRCGQVGSQR